MSTRRCVSTGLALLVVCGCGNSLDTLHPTAPPSAVSASAARQVETSGHFDALVDFSTLTLTPRGQNCFLHVAGRLVFTGTIAGSAVGHTGALVSAPCANVATTPPGTFSDVFKSELVFDGTVDGTPAHANLLYMGGVQPGGLIEGRLVFSNGVEGRLQVTARVAVGGDYRGQVVVK